MKHHLLRRLVAPSFRPPKRLFPEPAYHFMHGYEDHEGMGGDGDSSPALIESQGLPAASDGSVPQTQAAATPSASSSWFDSLVKGAESLVPLAASVYQQQQLTKLNLTRAQQGQPMITAANYAKTYQPPTATVAVGVTSQVQNLMMYGALGLGGVFLVGMFLRGRK